MTPAEELYAAATRLCEVRDALIAETKPPQQPLMWFAEDLIIGSTLTGGDADSMDHTLTRSEAAWLALITPELAEPLATWLNAVAEDMRQRGAVEGSASKQVHPTDFVGLGHPREEWTSALAAARVINGGAP